LRARELRLPPRPPRPPPDVSSAPPDPAASSATSCEVFEQRVKTCTPDANFALVIDFPKKIFLKTFYNGGAWQRVCVS
jgi:hypothetical protein